MAPRPRRNLLRLLGTTAIAVLAGCNTSPDDPGEPPPEAGTERSPRADQPATQTDAGTPTDPATRTQNPATAPLGSGSGRLPEEPWPLLRRGVSNGAYLPAGPRFAEEPAAEWRIEPSVPPDQTRYTPEFTTPVIADGRLYTVNRLRFGTNVERPDRHFLRAYDAATGDERWERAIRHGSASSVPTNPAVGDRVVLVGHDRMLRAVGLASGTEAWRRTLGEPVHAVYPGRDRTYVRAHRSVVAIEATNELAWFPGALARGDRNLYVAVSRRVLAFDPATGDLRWRRTLPAGDGGYGVRRLVTVAGGVLALQHSGDLYALTETRKEVWRADDRYDSMATDGTRVYAVTNGTLRSLDVVTGTRQWERRCADIAGCDPTGRFGQPVVTDGALYATLDPGGLVAVRPDDGTVRWRLDGTTNAQRLALGTDAIYGVGGRDDPLVRFGRSGTDRG